LWLVDGHPVSMVNKARRMRNGATINAVFTPDEHKRKGYATNAVAALSQKLLDAGFVFCSLHTDLANPTSNNIYRKIGYYAAGTSIVYKFDMELCIVFDTGVIGEKCISTKRIHVECANEKQLSLTGVKLCEYRVSF